MTTPLATIADALIEFIMSLLRDPAAVAELEEDTEGVLARNGLSDVCAEDIRAVAPVIVDRPDVIVKPVTPPPPPGPPSIVKEIQTITQNLTIDNRSTIIDQSVNQSIWAEGDVNQIFDQEAVVASGDSSVAAGDDATVDNSETEVTVGDVAIGNTETTTEINDSFDDESTNTEVEVEADVEESFNDSSTNVDVDTSIEDSFQQDITTVDITDVSVEYVDDQP